MDDRLTPLPLKAVVLFLDRIIETKFHGVFIARAFRSELLAHRTIKQDGDVDVCPHLLSLLDEADFIFAAWQMIV